MKKQFAKKDEVIALLKAGWEIYSRRKEHFSTRDRDRLVYSSKTYGIYHDGEDSKPVHHSTIQALKDEGIINNKCELIS